MSRARPQVFLFHWHEGEAAERASRLRRLGCAPVVHWSREQGSNSPALKALATDPPDAVVIDLGRLPSHGMAVATWLRERKGTRRVPLVFVPGDAQKTARARARFPDAAFAPWARMRTALPRAIANPPRDPVVPRAPDYSGTPLWQKLGVRERGRVALVRAPQGFDPALPAGATTTARLGGTADVVLLFCRSLAQLQRDFARAAASLAERGGLWVAWPKKAARQLTDLDESKVRSVGLGAGLVDNKVCAIDAVWSGLRFARRRGADKA
jgi:CheY-like chemotaxis protein